MNMSLYISYTWTQNGQLIVCKKDRKASTALGAAMSFEMDCFVRQMLSNTIENNSLVFTTVTQPHLPWKKLKLLPGSHTSLVIQTECQDACINWPVCCVSSCFNHFVPTENWKCLMQVCLGNLLDTNENNPRTVTFRAGKLKKERWAVSVRKETDYTNPLLWNQQNILATCCEGCEGCLKMLSTHW